MYRWIDHTAELELYLEAPDEADVFREGFAALGELLARADEVDEAGSGRLLRFEVAVSGPDRATLLAEWLGELLYLGETEAVIPERVESLRLGTDDLEAIVIGRRGSPSALVKAVTYHRLAMHEEQGKWRATVVLDV